MYKNYKCIFDNRVQTKQEWICELKDHIEWQVHQNPTEEQQYKEGKIYVESLIKDKQLILIQG